jgi:pyruvate/2-oxoglutarate dehydrogenase complex dihydrolipoamide acyltransferase (E2) component
VTTLEFRLPDIGEGIAEADIVAWKVAEGDRVREDQELVDIQTDKAVVGIPAPVTGVVERLCAAEGETLAVGAVLAVFRPDGSDGARRPEPVAESAAAAEVPPPGRAGAPAASRPAVAARRGPAKGPLAAPATRSRARELGVDLAAIAGSGPHGRILREDVERAAQDAAPAHPGRPAPPTAPVPPATPGEVIPLRGVRRVIARELTRAWQEVPRITDYREVDATNLMDARRRLQRHARERGDEALAAAITPTPLIAKAVLRGMRDHPLVNASIDLERDEITVHAHRHLGIATAAPDGLVVPVVHDADRRSLAELALEIAELSRAARERRLRPADLAGATLTVNNYGGLGIWLGTPIVRPPEVVNFGVGAVRDQVVAVDGAPVVRPTLVVAVSGDHRLLDGATLGAFVTQVVRLLEDPVRLLEDAR